jgi:hypothetical protein
MLDFAFFVSSFPVLCFLFAPPQPFHREKHSLSRPGKMNKYFVWFALISAVQAACFFPNGTISTTSERCRHDTEHSPCCGKGYKCLSNGLCQVSDVTPDKPAGWEYARGGCTDKTFGSQDCPRFCLDSKLDRASGAQIMYKCPNLAPDVYVCGRGDRSEDCRSPGIGQRVNLGT